MINRFHNTMQNNGNFAKNTLVCLDKRKVGMIQYIWVDIPINENGNEKSGAK